MNTKTAIRTLKEFDLTEDKQNDIIKLLQRGEKYEAIVEKIKYELDTPKAILINGEDIRNRIEQIERR